MNQIVNNAIHKDLMCKLNPHVMWIQSRLPLFHQVNITGIGLNNYNLQRCDSLSTASLETIPKISLLSTKIDILYAISPDTILCVRYETCAYSRYMYTFNNLNKTPHPECLKLHRSARRCLWIPCSPRGWVACSSSSCPRQRAFYRSRCHRRRHSRPDREPSPWWYPCESACTCCSGAQGEIARNADPARRSSTPWWRGTNGTLAWSRHGTCSKVKSAENQEKCSKRKAAYI